MLKSGILSLILLLGAAPASAAIPMPEMSNRDPMVTSGNQAAYQQSVDANPANMQMQGSASMQKGNMQQRGMMPQRMKLPPNGEPMDSGDHHGDRGMGSTTGSGAASTTMHVGGEWGGMNTGTSSKKLPPMMMGTPGMVASVAANSFTMTIPQERDRATTTVTVNVSSNTVFMGGAATSSLANIMAGSRVVVIGKVSTSTKSIAAERVIIMQNQDMQMMQQSGNDQKRGVLQRIKSFFGGKRSDNSMQGDSQNSQNTMGNSGPAAAGQNDGIVSTIFHTIFGWL
jgi:hypothetical protein